jgi:hypothetical protein
VTKRFSSEQLLSALRACSEEVGGYPSVAKWNSWQGRICNEKTIIHRFGTWVAAVTEAGVRYPRDNTGAQRRYSKEKLLADLRQWADSEGKVPTIGSWDCTAFAQGRANTKTYRTVFGTWSAALEAAGLTPRPGWTDGPRFSSPECVDALRAFFKAHGESPTQNGWPSWARPRGLMSEKAIARRLGEGSWNRALEVAGLPTRQPGQTRVTTSSRKTARNRQMVTAGLADVHPRPWDRSATVESIRGGGN